MPLVILTADLKHMQMRIGKKSRCKSESQSQIIKLCLISSSLMDFKGLHNLQPEVHVSRSLDMNPLLVGYGTHYNYNYCKMISTFKLRLIVAICLITFEVRMNIFVIIKLKICILMNLYHVSLPIMLNGCKYGKGDQNNCSSVLKP